jgi:hypothetical protein
MGQEKLYMGQESLIGWDRRRQLMGQEKLILHQNKTIFWQQMSYFHLFEDDCYQNCTVIVTKNLR